MCNYKVYNLCDGKLIAHVNVELNLLIYHPRDIPNSVADFSRDLRFQVENQWGRSERVFFDIDEHDSASNLGADPGDKFDLKPVSLLRLQSYFGLSQELEILRAFIFCLVDDRFS